MASDLDRDLETVYPPATRCTIYRAFDALGELLYVGITGTGEHRIHQHRATSAWWPHCHTLTLTHYQTRDEAIKAEKHAIRTEKPRYNIQHNANHRPLPLPDRPMSGGLNIDMLVSGHQRIPAGRPDLADALNARLRREFGVMDLDDFKAKILDGTIPRDDPRIRGMAHDFIHSNHVS